MKAAIYARYSCDLQRAASIEDQSRNCRKRADAERWTISATFADAAISGTVCNRPQYTAMLAAAERCEFGVLLLDDLSRLARDSVEQERIIRRLEFRGLRIIATCDGLRVKALSRGPIFGRGLPPRDLGCTSFGDARRLAHVLRRDLTHGQTHRHSAPNRIIVIQHCKPVVSIAGRALDAPKNSAAKIFGGLLHRLKTPI